MKNILIGIGLIVVIGTATYALVPRSVLKEYFQAGDKPTQQQFSNMLDSSVNRSENQTEETIEVNDVQTEPADHQEVDSNANEGLITDTKISIAWRFSNAAEIDAIPYTNVSAVINGAAHEMGTFKGSCSEIGANGGVDGKGLLAGELSAVQCWFAGGGNEIAVFAHEDGGVDLMVGELSEGEEGTGLFRGNFTIKNTLKF